MDAAVMPLHEALARVARGPDVQAWSAMLVQVGDDLRRLAARLVGPGQLADDAVQEALLQVREHAGRFVADPADGAGSARRWLMGMTAHAALSLRRGDARRRARERRGAPMPSPSPSPSQAMEQSELADGLRDALAELPEHERLAVSLRHVAGFDYPAIAARLDCPVGTAKARVSRGLDRLRGRLARSGLLLGAAAIAGMVEALEAPAQAGATALAKAPALITDAVLRPTTRPYAAPSTKVLLMASCAVSIVLVSALSALLVQPTVAVERSADGVATGSVAGDQVAPSPSGPTRSVSASVSTATPEQERAHSELKAAILRLAGPVRPGISQRAQRLDDGRLIVVLSTRQTGEVQILLGDAEGGRLWQGPATTAAERSLLPAEVAAFLAREQAAQQGRQQAATDLSAKIDALLAPYAGTFTSQATVGANGFLAITIDRAKGPWLIAATAAGDKLWEGPVGSPAERELIPEEIAQALGYERFAVDANQGELKVEAKPEAQASAPQ